MKGLGAERLSEPSDRHRKSLSNETTFQSTGNISELTEICSQLCRELADSLQGEQLKGRCLTLKTKTVMFQTKVPLINKVRKNPEFLTPSPLLFSCGSHRPNPPPK